MICHKLLQFATHNCEDWISGNAKVATHRLKGREITCRAEQATASLTSAVAKPGFFY